MKLRSGSMPGVTFDQEASSCVMPLATPPSKRGRLQKRCIYVDDETDVEEDSNNLNDVIEATGTHVEEQEDIPHVEGDSQEENSDSENEDNQRSKHKRIWEESTSWTYERCTWTVLCEEKDSSSISSSLSLGSSQTCEVCFRFSIMVGEYFWHCCLCGNHGCFLGFFG
ncbi:hypothetical protein L7F22_007557 [Adiantum nelumboides]|nr:hypothetical protein [Adiantum nelumboides]